MILFQMEKVQKLVWNGKEEKLLTRKPRQTNAPVYCSFQVNIYPRSQQTANFSIMILLQMEKVQK